MLAVQVVMVKEESSCTPKDIDILKLVAYPRLRFPDRIALLPIAAYPRALAYQRVE